jgi:tetratricopeptide (TPR) repeat protein
MTNNHEEIMELIGRGDDLGFTQEAVAVLEEAVRLADAAEDHQLGFLARDQLMWAAAFTGNYDKLIVAFTWCLAKADRFPDEFDAENLLWRYKWVIENLVHFPTVSRKQIFSFLEDFRNRSVKAGFTQRSPLFLQWTAEMHMGNLENAVATHALWRNARRDVLADCPGCECHCDVELCVMQGQHELAIRKAAPILQGKVACAEIPHLTYAALLRSYRALGNHEAATAAHDKGYRLVRRNQNFVREQAWHLDYLVDIGDLEKAVELLRRHLPMSLEIVALDFRLEFLLATRRLLHHLQEKDIRSLRARIPQRLCPVAGKASVNIADLEKWVNAQAEDLAAQFDARNGNTGYADRLRRPPGL